MRRNARVDGNHAAIVHALRAMGVSVQSLATVGDGCPDLLLGFATRSGSINLIVELKNDALPPSARRLTPAQKRWHANWRGPIAVIENVAEAVALVSGMRGRG